MKTKHAFFLGLLISFILCLGCSKSDDATDAEKTLEEQFIGIWKPIKFVAACSSGSSETEIYSTCEQTGRLTINANGNWAETYFYEYTDNMCEEDGVSNGTWKIVNGKLIVNESEFEEAEVTFFEISGNTLKVGQYDDDYPCGADDTSSYYYKEYIKI
ncbi:lipocalin-like domain-containing protein [Seonamhaeicola maritimus]|uniref:Lipocalin family protein n=1 Tax=Seonamhaeicola maritimus TaxID=2591822 RepID=A0A5C7GK51_9FLAO|nr:lipocalin family protein [Seonamhaeicola maritimus]TXG38664.1 lipocalin family protein [Seonamhaeicola maritimus]